MFNYLGPDNGPGPVATQLPSGAPGTIPGAIPGVMPSGMPAPPNVSSAIQQAPAGIPAPSKEHDPSSLQYVNETQADGSVLMRIVNADGTPGPVVKLVPMKAPKAA